MAERVTYWNSYPPAGVTCSGDPVALVYKEKAPGELVEVGKRDLQKEYNAAAVGITPYEIFDRCVKTGDLSALDDYSDKGGDVDASGLPDNLADAVAAIDAGEKVAADLKAAEDAAQAAAAASAALAEQKKEEGK